MVQTLRKSERALASPGWGNHEDILGKADLQCWSLGDQVQVRGGVERRGAAIQSEAAKELKQGSVGVSKRVIGEVQRQCKVRGGGDSIGTVWMSF